MSKEAREALAGLMNNMAHINHEPSHVRAETIKDSLTRLDELEEQDRFQTELIESNAELIGAFNVSEMEQQIALTKANERIAELEETESLEVGKYRSDKERLIKQLSLYGDCPFGSSYSSPDCPDSCPGDTHNNFTECWQSWLQGES